jgi:hypothetical protein
MLKRVDLHCRVRRKASPRRATGRDSLAVVAAERLSFSEAITTHHHHVEDGRVRAVSGMNTARPSPYDSMRVAPPNLEYDRDAPARMERDRDRSRHLFKLLTERAGSPLATRVPNPRD